MIQFFFTAPDIVVELAPSGPTMLGQNGYSLTCGVSGADNLDPSIAYEWTKKNGAETQLQVGSDANVVSFSPLRLSDAGEYTCQVNVSSSYLSNNIIRMSRTLDITVQSELC